MSTSGWISNQINVDGTKFTTSFWHEQVDYLVAHSAPGAGDLDGTVRELTYMACDSDEFVRPDAADAWAASKTDTRVVHVASRHVDYQGQSELWNREIEMVLEQLSSTEE